jgi:hypothetical protein
MNRATTLKFFLPLTNEYVNSRSEPRAGVRNFDRVALRNCLPGFSGGNNTKMIDLTLLPMLKI